MKPTKKQNRSIGIMIFQTIAMLSLLFLSAPLMAKDLIVSPPLYSSAEFEKDQKWLGGLSAPKRQPTSDSESKDISLPPIADDYAQFVREFTALRSADQIDPFINKIEKQFEKASPALKLSISHLQTLNELRGVIFRLSPLLTKNSITQFLAKRDLNNLSFWFQNQGPHMVAIWDYLNLPTQQNLLFKTNDQFQAFLIEKARPRLKTLIDNLIGLANTSPVIPIDLRLVKGIGLEDYMTTTSTDYRYITKSELYLEIGAILKYGLHSISLFSSFDLNNWPEMIKDYALQYKGTFDTGAMHLFSAFKIFKTSFSKSLQLKPEALGENGLMANAYQNLVAGVNYENASLYSLLERPTVSEKNAWTLLNPQTTITMKDQLLLIAKTRAALVSEKTALVHRTTKMGLVVDLPAFYKKPQSLQAFLPNDHYKGSALTTSTTIDNKKITTLNLQAGRAKAWGKGYETLFPDQKEFDFNSTIKILSHSWGGEELAVVLSWLSE